MATNRAPADRDRDRAAVAEAYLRGVPQYQIALDQHMTTATVSRDVAWLHTVWADRFAQQIDAQKAAELARIDALERTYWAAWTASQGKASKVASHAEAAPDGSPRMRRAVTTTEERAGNPAYLSGVQWCIDRRCKLLGMDAPTKIAPTTPDGLGPYAPPPSLSALPLEDRRTLADILRRAVDAAPGGGVPSDG